MSNQPKTKHIIRSIYISSATLVLSALTYMLLVNLIPKTGLLVIGGVILCGVIFLRHRTEAFTTINKRSFLIPLAIVATIALIDTASNDRKPSGLKFNMPSNAEQVKRTNEALLIEQTKDRVRNQLKDPKSAEFRNMRFVTHQGTPAACGEVNSKNSYGGMSGFQRFVASGGNIVLLEEQAADFDNVWNELCQ